MGLWTTFVAGLSYMKAMVFKRKERSLEDFYVNRFGYKLYSMFFERYTENLWGRHPSQIDPSWGAQRVKGVSIIAVVKNAFSKIFFGGNRKVETSLIEEFSYPKLGPGQLWEITANEVVRFVRAVEESKDSSITSLYKLADGRAEAQEYEVLEDSWLTGVMLKDLRRKPNLLIGAIIRDGEFLAPSGSDVIMKGDHIVIVTRADNEIRSLSDIAAEA